MIRLALLLLILIAAAPPAFGIDFDHDVVPILREHCVKCHGGSEAEGGFSINSRGLFLESDAAEPGNPGESHFLDLIRSQDIDQQMPPKDLPRVPKDQQAVLAKWVDAGMPWTSGFTFAESKYRPPLLPRTVELPGPAGANPIDQIIGQHLVEREMAAPSSIDDAGFLRRASLDLNGLLPAPEALDEFLGDTASDKRQRLIDDLLSRDIAYAEHWLTFWNDLLRNDYTGTGFITGGRRQITGWLYRSLIDNKPFDQFTRELVAPESDASRGFIDGIKWRGDVSAGQTNEIQFAQSVAQSFLGINLKCASCHDSFIDRWKLREAYSLAAVYASGPLQVHRCDKPTGDQAQPGWLFPELGQIDPAAPRQQRLQQLAALVTHRDNGRYTRTIVNRLWGQLMGRGLVHPLDAMHTEPWNAELLDFLAEYLVENNYDLKAVLRLIATSDAYASRSEELEEDPANETGYVYRGRRAKRLTAEQFIDAVWQLTGAAPSQFDAPVMRGKVDSEAAQNMELQGRWIWGDSASPGQVPPAGEQLVFRKKIALASDVASGGAVITADNGFELYVGRRKLVGGDEWTKVQTVAMVGQLKPGDNEIVVVARNGGSGPNAAGLFFEARLNLADGSQVAISSDDTWQYSDQGPIGGREGRLGKTPGPWKDVTVIGQPQVYARVDQSLKQGLAAAVAGEASMVRASLVKSDFLMRSLGRPNRDQIVTSRPSELTTLEAIDLANGAELAKMLQTGAAKWNADELSTTELTREIYRFALSREPTTSELATIVESLGNQPDRQAVEDLLWAVCMMPEFMMNR